VKTFRKQVFEFIPQIDVEMPSVRIEEDECNIPSYGAVYNIILRERGNSANQVETCLTVEELVAVRNHINHLLEVRDKDKNRQK
jgi:hypothetical protein